MATKKTRPSRLGRGLSSLMATPVEVDPGKTKADTEKPRDVKPGKPSPATPADPEGKGVPDQSETPDRAEAGSSENAGSELVRLPVGSIQPNRHQPRQHFDPGSIATLAESIRSQGLMQPIVVRPSTAQGEDSTGAGGSGGSGDSGDSGGYELIAGERRWRAAKQAGLEVVPAIVRAIDDQQAAEWALIENLQREDLNPIEKAEAFQRLAEQFALSHAEIAKRVGLERSSVSNLLRLLELSDFVRDLVRQQLLSMGQARAIAGVTEPAQQRALAERAVREGWSVRQVEAEARRLTQPAKAGAGTASGAGGGGSAVLSDLEKQLGEQLGTRVKIKAGKKKGAGTLAIDFYSLDEFDALLARLDVKTQ